MPQGLGADISEGRDGPDLQVASSPQQLDEVARAINDICRRATLDLAYHVGELIVRHIFLDLRAWSECGTRHPSYRQLSSRGDLLMSPSALCRSVGVYALSERLGGKSVWRHLGASHLQEVLHLDPPVQERLLRVAEAERWTLRRLREEVRKRRVVNDKTRQRSLGLSIRRLNLLLESIGATLGEGGIGPGAVNEEILHDVRRAVRLMKEHGSTLETALEQATPEEHLPTPLLRSSYIRDLRPNPEPTSGNGGD